MSKTLDNFFVIVYNCNIRDVPFIAVVDKFWRTVDKEDIWERLVTPPIQEEQ